MLDVLRTFSGSFDKMVIPLSQLEKGRYAFEGAFSDSFWQAWCKAQGFSPKGACSAAILFDLDEGVMDLSGNITFSLERVCVRTLRPFMASETLSVDDRLSLKYKDEGGYLLKGGTLEVASYVLEQVLLQLEPYPLHPDLREKGRGGLVWSDNFSKNNEKNPFFALKDLQKSSKSGTSAPRLQHKVVSPVSVKGAK